VRACETPATLSWKGSAWCTVAMLCCMLYAVLVVSNEAVQGAK
jgi:hypothetical protein